MIEDAADPAFRQGETLTERRSDRELVITRAFAAPARLVFETWSEPGLFKRWWVPASCGITLISYEADVRTGGTYRLVMGHPSSEAPMSFFGRYLEVTSPSRIVWTNDEGDDAGAVTTATFEERDGATLIVVTDRYQSKDALDEAIASGSTSGWGEQFDQLDALIGHLDRKA